MRVRTHRKLRGTGTFTGLRLPNTPCAEETEVAKIQAGKSEGHTFLKHFL